MSSTTPYLGLTLYDSTTDQAVAFATFRAVWGGPATSSNFYKIDTGLFDLDARIDILESYRGAIPVSANYISANYYEASGVTGITAYTSGMAIVLSLDTTSSGTVTLNINALGTKSLMKIDSTGTAINLTGSDLVKNRRALFVYDGTRWLWVSANSADQISIVGTAGNVVTVNADNTLLGTLTQSVLISQTTNAATAKTTPVDADRFGFWDSVSGLLNHVTWANIKATLATVFAPAILPNRNVIINGGFTINQRAYASAAALATTVYGHDRWKAGAGGGDYSFTQLASPTTITIAANKTLIQVVEDKNVYGGTYILSWVGTCQARYAINSATPAGAYAASPIIITGQTPGTTMSVEFGNGASTGTLGNVQLELGSVATPFEFRPYAQELALCQRYFNSHGGTSAFQGVGIGYAYQTNGILVLVSHVVQMRTAPTLGYSAVGDWMCTDGAAAAASAVSVAYAGILTSVIEVSQAGTTWTVGRAALFRANNTTDARLTFSAEL